MGKFITRIFVNAFALAVIVTLLPQGIRIEAQNQQAQLVTLVGVALIFGLVNAFVKPILQLLTCSLVFFTLGLFLLVINGAMFMLTAELSARLPFLPGRLVVENFGWAIVGAVLMSIIGVISEHVLGLNKKREKVEVVREVRYVERPQPPGNVYFPPENPYGPPPPPPPDKPKRQ